MKDFNNGHYPDWRDKRISKLVSIFGADFFKGKDILELGCGWGHIGERLIQLGSTVTFCDVRPEHVLQVKSRIQNCTTHVLDQNVPWDLGKQFDFIIHTGVLYHLTEWRQDLRCTLNHAPLIFLETVVSKNKDEGYEELVEEPTDLFDQAPSGWSVRPTTEGVEKFLASHGVRFERYDDSDINSGPHIYDWSYGDGSKGNRRFWILYND